MHQLKKAADIETSWTSRLIQSPLSYIGHLSINLIHELTESSPLSDT